MQKINLDDLQTIGCMPFLNAKVTKVKTTKDGFRVQLFNPYVTLYYLNVVLYDSCFKIHWLIKKNYHEDYRFTSYYDSIGNEITRKEFKNLKN